MPRPRFLSESDCRDVAERLARFAKGGGYTSVGMMSVWTGSVRWARNQVTSSGEVSNNSIYVHRIIDGANGTVWINDTTDAALDAAVRRAERFVALSSENPNSDLIGRRPLEPSVSPALFSDATYQVDANRRAAAALDLTKQAAAAGMLSAGYIEVAAVSMALLDTLGRVRYFPYTQARYSVTVRDPKGTSSGWAGIDDHDWQKIDAAELTARALDKCLKSRNAVAIEPGRYTTILEPQAVSDFVGQLVYDWSDSLSRSANEGGASPPGPFLKSEPSPASHYVGYSRLGEKVVDERITISANPVDPALGFAPFKLEYHEGDDFVIPVYHAATWIDHGVLTNLSYPRGSEIIGSGRDVNLGMPNSGAFRMTGGDTSVDEMIATTKRGILVTRFDQIITINRTSQLYRGFTRDGLWLIENGKISRAVKNMVFTESVLFALNNLEQLGPPQRVFHPNVMLRYGISQPVIVPPLKVKDFSFTALADAV